MIFYNISDVCSSDFLLEVAYLDEIEKSNKVLVEEKVCREYEEFINSGKQIKKDIDYLQINDIIDI